MSSLLDQLSETTRTVLSRNKWDIVQFLDLSQLDSYDALYDALIDHAYESGVDSDAQLLEQESFLVAGKKLNTKDMDIFEFIRYRYNNDKVPRVARYTAMDYIIYRPPRELHDLNDPNDIKVIQRGFPMAKFNTLLIPMEDKMPDGAVGSLLYWLREKVDLDALTDEPKEVATYADYGAIATLKRVRRRFRSDLVQMTMPTGTTILFTYKKVYERGATLVYEISLVNAQPKSGLSAHVQRTMNQLAEVEDSEEAYDLLHELHTNLLAQSSVDYAKSEEWAESSAAIERILEELHLLNHSTDRVSIKWEEMK